MLVFFLVGSISFFDKPGARRHERHDEDCRSMPVESFGWGTLFAGGITSAQRYCSSSARPARSAQIPLFVWLPDAMAGPTPVSALIHAATMVTAGVYMVVRCIAIYTHAPTAMFIIAIVGAATAIFAATIGIAQNDIKKVLAYSTVSQLGYMFLACGVGAFVAAIFHVMTHAFFKALLFLGSGSVIHGMHHEQDMRRMGGLSEVHADHVRHDDDGLARDLRHPHLRGLLLEGRDSLEDVEHGTVRPERGQNPVGRRRDDGAFDRHLHDAPDDDDLLGRGAIRAKPTQAARPTRRTRTPTTRTRSRTTRARLGAATARITSPDDEGR